MICNRTKRVLKLFLIAHSLIVRALLHKGSKNQPRVDQSFAELYASLTRSTTSIVVPDNKAEIPGQLVPWFIPGNCILMEKVNSLVSGSFFSKQDVSYSTKDFFKQGKLLWK